VSVVTVSNTKAAGYLAETYGWELDVAARALAIARQVAPGPDAEPTEAGIVTITWTGREFEIEDAHR
jgi:hypothetical protein